MSNQKNPTANKMNSSKEWMGEKLIKGFLWMSGSSALNILFQVLITMILSRILDPTDFGIIASASLLICFAEILCVGPMLVQKKDLNDEDIATCFAVCVIIGPITFSILFVIAPFFGEFFHSALFVPLFRTISLVFILHGLSDVAQALLQRRMRFRSIGFIQVISYCVGYGIVSIALAMMGAGAWALAIGILAQECIKSIAFMTLMPHKKSFKIQGSSFRQLIFFGGGFSLSKLFNNIAVHGDNLIVGRFLGVASLGLYSKAYQLMVIPSQLVGAVLDQVLFPAMSGKQEDKEGLKRTYSTLSSFVSITMLPLTMLLIIAAPEIVGFLLGPKWTNMVLPFQILVSGLFFRTAYKISEALSRAVGAVYRRAWGQGIYAVAVLLGSYIGMSWGIIGVAVAGFFALALNYYVMIRLSASLIRIRFWECFPAVPPTFVLLLFPSIVVYAVRFVVMQFMTSSGLILVLETMAFIFSYLLILIHIRKRLLPKELADLIDLVLKKCNIEFISAKPLFKKL